MSSFTNSTVLITGAASGIGLLMAKKAVQRKAKAVILWDINHKALQKVVRELPESDAEVSFDIVDVSNPKQVKLTAAAVMEQYESLDILFNNAGIVVGKGFAEHSYDEIKRTMEINSQGLMFVARAFLPEMTERESGHIVNIASAAGLMPNPGMTVYAASKWAAVGWSESLRIELEQRQTSVRVTTVMPSYINTGMFDGVQPPKLVPWLDPDFITDKIFDAVENNKILLREPFMVKLIPLLRGILPARTFDYIAGRLFKVYESMDTFKGRN